jgi:hypothetical protein
MHELSQDRHEVLPQTVEGLRDFLHQPEIAQPLRQAVAQRMQETVCTVMEIDEIAPAEMDEAAFTGLYDSSLPTIAIDAESSFKGKELVGLAAWLPDSRVNIVYITPTLNEASIVSPQNGLRHLEVRGGLIVTPSGQVVYGDFPRPVRAGLFETGDISLLAQCKELAVPSVHDYDTHSRFNNKRYLPEVVGASVNAPERLHPDTLDSHDVSDLVIKPEDLSKGHGVFITDSSTDPSHAKALYEFLSHNEYGPLIEKRVRCFPFVDPESGQLLDWSARAFISQGELLDLFIRTNPVGQPTNQARGAEAVGLNDISRYVQDEPTAKLIIRRLMTAGQRLAQDFPVALTALDLVVDDKLMQYLFEFNYGQMGGLRTVMKREATSQDKLRIPRTLIKQWLSLVPEHQVTSEDTIAVPLRSSFMSLSKHCYAIGRSGVLADISTDTLPTANEEDRYGIIFVLLAAREKAFSEDDTERVNAIDQALIDRFPLEIRSDIVEILANAPYPHNYDHYRKLMARLFPADQVWQTLERRYQQPI